MASTIRPPLLWVSIQGRKGHQRGIPTFKFVSSILNTCPTCIWAKQTKARKQTINTGKHINKGSGVPCEPHSTKYANLPYQKLSIDFSFSGLASSNSEPRVNYEGINGETAWILVTDHFTGIQHGDTRILKATPVLWLKHFLTQYNPTCTDKYIYMDQGSELFNNPEIKNLFTKSGYCIYPTGVDASNQNGPVEQAHRSIADTIRALLTGPGINNKFWPYAFYHALRLHNSIVFKDVPINVE